MRTPVILLATLLLAGPALAQLPAAAPVLVVAPITDTAYTSREYIVVNATTTDDETGVNATLAYNIIGDWITTRASGGPEGIVRNFTARIPVPEQATGTTTVRYFVNATDRDRNNATSGLRTLAVTVTDVTAPSVSIDAGDTLERRPSVLARLRDAGSGIDPATVVARLDDQAVTPTVSGTNATIVPPADLADGIHTLFVSLKDKAGNEGNDTVTFRVGSVPGDEKTPLPPLVPLASLGIAVALLRRRRA